MSFARTTLLHFLCSCVFTHTQRHEKFWTNGHIGKKERKSNKHPIQTYTLTHSWIGEWVKKNRLKALEWNLCKCWKGALLFSWPNKRNSLFVARRVTYIEHFFPSQSLSLSRLLDTSLFSFAWRNWRAKKEHYHDHQPAATRSTVRFNPFSVLVSQHKRIINRMNTPWTKNKCAAYSLLFSLGFLYIFLSFSRTRAFNFIGLDCDCSLVYAAWKSFWLISIGKCNYGSCLRWAHGRVCYYHCHCPRYYIQVPRSDSRKIRVFISFPSKSNYNEK